MEFLAAGSNKSLLIILLFFVSAILQTRAETKVCYSKGSPCFMKKIQCPTQCPSSSPSDPKVTKVCAVNCNSPICKAECKSKNIQLFSLYLSFPPANFVHYIMRHFPEDSCEFTINYINTDIFT